MRRWATRLTVMLLASGVVASGWFAYSRLDVANASGTPETDGPAESESPTESESPPESESPTELMSDRATAEASTVDLIDEDEVSGQLGYGDASEWVGHGGVVTHLPDVGEVLELGDTAWDVDGHAGPAVIYGDLPPWRRLDRNADDGADILQLEYNLVQLGFGAEMTVDDDWDSDTTEAVRDWQESRGLERTGVVELGDLIVSRHPMRVDEHKAGLGATAEGAVLSVTLTEQEVTMDVGISDLDLFEQGGAVLVELPDDRRVEGTVTDIAKTATADQDGNVTVAVSVSLAEPEPSLIAAPVTVVVQRTRASDALVVPVRALLALAEGGYAVEKVTGGGTTLVGVELGEFGDGVVQITSGDLARGDTVVIAP